MADGGAAIDSTGMILRDAATGLPSWELYQDRLAHALLRAARREHTLTVGLVSVDFPTLGDQAGPAGWRAALAARMLEALRDDDTVAVTPGPLFAVMMEDGAGELSAAAPAQRLLATVLEPVEGVAARMQIGLAVALPPAPGPRPVLLQAEVALARAMQRAESTFAVFDSALDTRLLHRLTAAPRDASHG